MTEKPLPCPFCGGEVTKSYVGSSDWHIECQTCPVSHTFWVSGAKYGYGEGEAAELIRRWNTRADAAPADRDSEFKNFHRQLCERFGYHHDDKDWKRDQISLIEFIASLKQSAAPVEWSDEEVINLARTYCAEFSDETLTLDDEGVLRFARRLLEGKRHD